MDLYEHQGKELFRAQGIVTPKGIVAETPSRPPKRLVSWVGGAS